MKKVGALPPGRCLLLVGLRSSPKTFGSTGADVEVDLENFMVVTGRDEFDVIGIEEAGWPGKSLI